MTVNKPFETFPEFLPEAVKQLTESTSVTLAKQICQASISTALSDHPIPTTYIRQGQGQPPLLLLHGFDSSVLEFRRFIPHLAAFRETWAIDLLGFGFTDRTQTQTLTPDAIKHHLHCTWQQLIGQPVVLVGASMGGAAALDFVLSYPNAVSRLILLDSAGLAVAPAMEKLMFPPLDRWATAFLKNAAVRRRISRQAYHDQTLVTPDAEVCASLHLNCPNWSEALIAFTKSGGYNFLTQKIKQLEVPTQVIWGRQDKILGTKDAIRFTTEIDDAHLVWIDECGHVPHLEKAKDVAAAIQNWLERNPNEA
ncbi:MAG: alpha/beta hydrolase [Leptolyngbya sp. SIO1D8]|nr:alpha/beta hydrolase [Leptolyngbya sp. SIO1D8]